MNPVRFLAIAAFYLMNQFNALGGGIEGEVIIRPLSPIERPGMVNYRPYQATVTVLDQKGQIVTEFQSGSDGRFRINLEPGTYLLRPKSPSRSLPRAPQQTVTVPESKFTHVSITYDSGIR
jgi:hypothetical protein